MPAYSVPRNKFSGAKDFQSGLEIVETEYTEIIYGNVCAAVKLFFPAKGKILDLCCGPGLCAQRIVSRRLVDPKKLILFDYNIDYLEAASKAVPLASVVNGDVFTDPIPFYDGCLFINATGYYSVERLRDIFKRLPPGKVIANFFVVEDQIFRHHRLISRRSGKFRYRLWNGEFLELSGLPEKALIAMLRTSGFSVRCEFRYFDFKFERLMLLEKE